MLIKIRHVSDSTLSGFQNQKPLRKAQILSHNLPKNIAIFNPREKHGFQPLSSSTKLHKYGSNRRQHIVCSVEPGASPPEPPPNILSWIGAVGIATVITFINFKWGPLIKEKVLAAMQITEDVVEAVEKVAEEVERVAEEMVDDLPEGGELRKAVDAVEKFAERVAKDAGSVDDFIDKVQEEEQKEESFVESLDDESKKAPEDTNSVKPKDQN